jgi:WXG100 family type VII secretion target
MAGYQTGAAELIQAAKNMEDTNQQLQGALKNVMGEVENVAASWSGQAHTAFQQLMSQFSDDANKLNQNLNQIAEAVSGSAAAYQRQEEESAQSVSSIQSMLGGM